MYAIRLSSAASLLVLATLLWRTGIAPALACGPWLSAPVLTADDPYGLTCDPDNPLMALVPPWDRPCGALTALSRMPVTERATAKRISTREVDEVDAARFGIGTPARTQWDRFYATPLAEVPPASAPAAWVAYRRAVGTLQTGQIRPAYLALHDLAYRPGRSPEARATAVRSLYMLGTVAANNDAEDTDPAFKDPPGTAPRLAAAHWRELRRRVRAGWPDPLGLASASLRWEAIVIANAQPGEALRLCRDYAAAGGKRPCVDVADLIQQTRRDPARLAAAARDPWLAAAVSAEIVHAPEADQQAWLDLLGPPAQNRSAQPAAGLAARIAYDRGAWDLAARWAARADRRDPEAARALARLARRAGDPRAVLAALARVPPDSETAGWKIAALLDLRRYPDALDAALRAGSWVDAAWIAERVLTPEELRRHLPRLPAFASDDAEPDDFYNMTLPDAAAGMRYLLARRLARLGRWEEAIPYFPADLQPQARAAADAHARLSDPTPGRADARRAAAMAFLDAVLPDRFALLAADGWPDWAVYEGAYAPGPDRFDLTARRLASPSTSADERARLARHAAERDPIRLPAGHPVAAALAQVTPPDPATPAWARPTLTYPIQDRRYHFLWHLAEIAWYAADLPDHASTADPASLAAARATTTQLLCRGGRLLRNLDPEAADLFYKALVNRGRPDPVAQVADPLRWFPPVDAQSRCLAEPWPPPAPPPNWEERRQIAWAAEVQAAQAAQAAAEAERQQKAAQIRQGAAGVGVMGLIVVLAWWAMERRG